MDPDQAQPHGCGFGTLNYVKYQPFAAGDPPGFVKSDDEEGKIQPLSLLTVGSCNAMTLGLGTVHPNARVNHFGPKQ